MKCCVCGAESGHYPLCRACNQKKEQGLIKNVRNAANGITLMLPARSPMRRSSCMNAAKA